MLSFGKVRRLQAQWGGTEGARGALLGMRTLREKLRGDLLALEQGGAIRRATVDEFNQLLAEHPMRSRLITRGTSYATDLVQITRAARSVRAHRVHQVSVKSKVPRTTIKGCVSKLVYHRKADPAMIWNAGV